MAGLVREIIQKWDTAYSRLPVHPTIIFLKQDCMAVIKKLPKRDWRDRFINWTGRNLGTAIFLIIATCWLYLLTKIYG